MAILTHVLHIAFAMALITATSGRQVISEQFRRIPDRSLDISAPQGTFDVLHLGQCAILCGRYEKCLTANYRKNNITGGFVCEFKDDQYLDSLVESSGNTVLVKYEDDVCLLSNPCENGGTCVSQSPPNYTCVCPVHCSGTHCETCCTIDGLHGQVTAVTVVEGGTAVTKDVFVESGPAGGDWIVLMRRQDGSVDFVNRDWNAYKAGFGNAAGEFWIGNELMHLLTNNGSSATLRLDLRAFTGECRFAEYSVFSVGPQSEKYRLTIGGYSGDAGDSFVFTDPRIDHRNKMFTTYDADNDIGGSNCAADYKGGWWYAAGFGCKLTGNWGEHIPNYESIEWGIWLGGTQHLQYADMKIRFN